MFVSNRVMGKSSNFELESNKSGNQVNVQPFRVSDIPGRFTPAGDLLLENNILVVFEELALFGFKGPHTLWK